MQACIFCSFHCRQPAWSESICSLDFCWKPARTHFSVRQEYSCRRPSWELPRQLAAQRRRNGIRIFQDRFCDGSQPRIHIDVQD